MKKLNTNKQSVIQRLLESPPRGGAWMRMFFMLVIMMMSSALATAQETYGIKVAGVEVTSENCKDLSVIEGVEGKISYNPETNTLTMQDVTIDNVDHGIFINSSEGLNIEVLGDNSITTKYVCITGWASPCRIGGSGTLRLKSAESAGIYAYNSQAVIVGIKLYTEGLYGIGGNDGVSGEMLALRNAYVEATGSNGSICDFQNVALDGCSITQPAGAAFDANVHAVALNGVKVTDKVVVQPDNYGILIAGKDVTTLNCKDLSIIEGVSGEVYFDPDTKTLTLVNATIEADGCNAIYNNTYKDLVIRLFGTNTINVTNSAGIYLCKSTTIKGESGSKLSIMNPGRCALLFENSPLEIVNCWLEAEGDWGISANNNVAEEVLTIRNSHVEATGPTGSICDIANLVLDGCSITQPEGAAYDAEMKGVVLNGEVVTAKVVIEQDNYGFKIAGKEVTRENCADLSVIEGVSGKVSYDPDTNTLTLENATITNEDEGHGEGIVNKNIAGFIIRLIGENTVTTGQSSLILNQPSIITGEGSLSLTSQKYCGLDMEGASVYIENTKLFVRGAYGIAGYSGSELEVLTVINSYVEAEGFALGSIVYLSNLILERCAITQPDGAEFSAQKRAVVLNGEEVKSKVVIDKAASGINDITADVPACKKGIFTVQGVKQTQSWNELPAGVYIVDGVKRVKR